MGRPSRTVLVCLHEEWLGGATLVVLRLVPLLEQRGWRFVFWVPPGPAEQWLRQRGARVFTHERPVFFSRRDLRLPPGPRRRLAGLAPYLWRFSRHVRKIAPDLIHANTVLTLPEATAARMSGAKVLLVVHDTLPPGPKGAIARRLARRLNGTIAVSRASAERFAHAGFMPRVVHNGVPLPPLVERPADRSPLVIGTVGVISTRKGSDTFVEAARLVREQRETVEFRMVGDFTDALEAEWARGVVERARAAGIQHAASADVFATLADWDMFVLPARRDPFPLVVLEAMASGLPVIAARSDGIPEQVTPQTGLLVEPDDPRALAEAIIQLVDDPERRRRLGEAGRRRVEQHFTLERQADELERAYLDAIAA